MLYNLWLLIRYMELCVAIVHHQIYVQVKESSILPGKAQQQYREHPLQILMHMHIHVLLTLHVHMYTTFGLFYRVI